MKILLTTDLYTTETNGVVTSVKNLTGSLIARGHEVKILTLAEGIHSYQMDNVYYIRSLPLGKVYPDVRMPTSYRHRLIHQLVEWRPDVIHSQCEFFSFQFAHYIARETGAPIVHTYHTLYEQYVAYVLPMKGLGEKAVGTLSRLRLKEVKHIIAPTKKVEDTLREYGIQTPISVIPSGIRLEQHLDHMTDEDRAQRRQALGIRPDRRVLVNVGRLGYEKNFDEILRYFAQTVSKEENYHILVVGDGPAREDLQKQAQELGIGDKVAFTGMVPPNQVHQYYQLGDVFVSASTSETQGLTYVEAAANGLPLLCRRDPCLKDVVIPGENGYMFTNAEEFRQGLDDIFADEGWLGRASHHSRTVAARFDKEAFGAAVEKVYKTVCQTSMQEEWA